jgi:hypothetical protein
MAYKSAIPQSTDKISVSQGDLLGNFTEVNTAWNLNHVPFNLSNEGQHWFISMPNQPITPSVNPPATNGTTIGLYATGGNLYFRPVSQTAGTVTNDVNLTNTTAGNATNGWMQFLSRVKQAWGIITVVPAGTTGTPGHQKLTLDNATIPGIPTFTTIYNAQVSCVQPGGLDKNVWLKVTQPVVAPATAGYVTVYNPNSSAIAAYVFVVGN